MQIFLVLLVVVSLFLFIIKIGGSYAGRMTGTMVTDYFKAAEALIEEDTMPAAWLQRLRQMARRGSLLQLLPGQRSWQERGEVYLLKQIHKVRTYFTKCPFVDTEESREILLSELDELIALWVSWGFDGITEHYGLQAETS